MKGERAAFVRRDAMGGSPRGPAARTLRLAALLLLALLGAVLVPREGAAQAWLGDRNRTEGPGFRLGNLELHPGLGVEGGYNNNPFLTESNHEPTWLMRISAHILASTIGTQRLQEGEGEGDRSQAQPKIAFRGGLSASYYHYFAEPSLSNVGADLGLNLTVNPEGRWRLNLTEEFSRTVQPFTESTPMSVSLPSYVRDRNLASLELSAHSPGDTLVGQLAYVSDIGIFEGEDFRYANSITHEMAQQLSWKMLPRTSLVQQTRLRYRTYPKSAGGASLLSDAYWLDMRAGVNGAITQKLSTSVLAGYSAGFMQDADDFEGFNLRLETRYRPRPSITLTLGYEHGFRPSYVGNYVESDTIDFTSRFLGFGALLVGLRGLLSFDESGLAVDDTGMLLGNTPRRNDIRLHLDFFAEYRFTNWLGVNATVGYSGDFTDYSFNDPGMGSTSVIPDPGGAYQQVEAWLGVRVFY